MFDWCVIKCGVQELERFCVGDLPIYTILILTNPSLENVLSVTVSGVSALTPTPNKHSVVLKDWQL